MAIEIEVRERPVLFSGAMVNAILAGRKSQTRRIFKMPRGTDWYPEMGGEAQGWFYDTESWSNINQPSGGWWHVEELSCPYGHVGERLWVRESLRGVIDTKIHADEQMPIAAYSADGAHAWTADKYRVPWKWSRGNLPSIHMPRALCRIVLEITEIRVERLQDISEEDAIAEGVEPNWIGDVTTGWNAEEHGWRNYCLHYPDGCECFPAYSAKESFEGLWNKINGDGAWESNPWVWAISFVPVQPSPPVTVK